MLPVDPWFDQNEPCRLYACLMKGCRLQAHTAAGLRAPALPGHVHHFLGIPPGPSLVTTRDFHWVFPLLQNLASSAFFSKTSKAPAGPRLANFCLDHVCVCERDGVGAHPLSMFFPDLPTYPFTVFVLIPELRPPKGWIRVTSSEQCHGSLETDQCGFKSQLGHFLSL